MVYYTISKRLAGDVQALALIAGFRSNVWGPYESGIFQVFIQKGHFYQNISLSLNMKKHAVDNARIVCFTVPNEILITRRNGRVAMHGNTKFAFHALRLGFEGIELLTDRRITLPVRPHYKKILMDIRTGKTTYGQTVELIEDAEDKLRELVEKCEWKADTDLINQFMIKAHFEHWG